MTDEPLSDDENTIVGDSNDPTGTPVPSAPDESLATVPGSGSTIPSHPNVAHPPHKAPKRIGPYKLLQQIGEGGMGAVWMAEQERPVRRRVAVKLIKAAIANKQTIARFEAERQALAMMDHPNIAKVLDAGTTDAGPPYFVMELVQGNPITEYCDLNKLTPRERLELFVQACDAVQHAHQKGIIHRDLKPSNVLVHIYNGEPAVKVIDFGLAKALEHQTRLTDKTVFTEFGRVLGTVQYMSPEQARLDAMDIDTRTDVYSLGVILYELLAGSTPIERKTVHEQALLEVLEMIRERDPPRPSHRLSTSLKTQDFIFDRRQIPPEKLQQLLRGELDWIIMRALEKDRTRRYATAKDFADDVQRYLAGEAVEACPPSTIYRLQKFVGKHRFAVGAVAALFLLVTTSAIAIAAYAAKANLARVEAERSQARAERAQVAAEQSADRAQQILQIVASSFESADPETGARGDMLASEVLIKAKESLEGSHLDEAGKRSLLQQLNYSLQGLGQYDQALEVGEQWLASAQAELGSDHPETLNAMSSVAAGYHLAGHSAKATSLLERTLELQKTVLGPDAKNTLNTMNTLALVYAREDRCDEAVELIKTAVELQSAKLGADHPLTLRLVHNLAIFCRDAHKHAEATELLERALRGRTAALGRDHLDTLRSMSSLASLRLLTGQTQVAIDLWEETLKLMNERLTPDHPAVLSVMHDLAWGYRCAGWHEEAIELGERTLELRTAALGEDHPNTIFSLQNLAMAYTDVGRLVDAVPLQEKLVERRRLHLGDSHVDTLIAIETLANHYLSLGRAADAIKLNEELVEQRSASLGPDHRDTLGAMNNLAQCYRAAGRLEEAISLHQKTVQQRRKVLGEDEIDTLTSMTNLVDTYTVAGQLDEAIEQAKQVIALQTAKLGEEHYDSLLTVNNLVWAIALEEGREGELSDELLGKLRRGLEITQNGAWFNTLALAEYRRGRYEEAIEAATASIDKMPKPVYPLNLAILALSHLETENPSKGQDYLEQFQHAMDAGAHAGDRMLQQFAQQVQVAFDSTELAIQDEADQ